MIVPKLHYFCYFRPCIVRDIQTEKLKVLSNQSILFGFPPLGGFRYLQLFYFYQNNKRARTTSQLGLVVNKVIVR